MDTHANAERPGHTKVLTYERPLRMARREDCIDRVGEGSVKAIAPRLHHTPAVRFDGTPDQFVVTG
jgi:hypothetical protein